MNATKSTIYMTIHHTTNYTAHNVITSTTTVNPHFSNSLQ